jgi:hypothetical protein
VCNWLFQRDTIWFTLIVRKKNSWWYVSQNVWCLNILFDCKGLIIIKFLNPFYLQIINDRSTRGKCYGFVTFTNPRSAISAINDMNDRVTNLFFINMKSGSFFLLFFIVGLRFLDL